LGIRSFLEVKVLSAGNSFIHMLLPQIYWDFITGQKELVSLRKIMVINSYTRDQSMKICSKRNIVFFIISSLILRWKKHTRLLWLLEKLSKLVSLWLIRLLSIFKKEYLWKLARLLWTSLLIRTNKHGFRKFKV